MTRSARRPLLFWIVGAAIVLSVFSTLIAWSYVQTFARFKTPLPALVGLNVSYWFAWAALVPGMLWMARRFPFDRQTWRRTLLAHLGGTLAFTFTHSMLATSGGYVTRLVVGSGDGPMFGFWPAFQNRFFLNFDFEMVTYWFIIGLSHALDYRRESEQRALHAAQLQTRLVEAQLQALQRQLHPHFLFNTLHTISALIHRDADAADAMLTRLSDLLRLTLDRTRTQQVSLKDELDFVQKYLEIEHTRFGDRLQVAFDVDPAVLDVPVPSMLLQPLVENALRHGIGPKVGGGRIDVVAQRQGDDIRLVVRDNGYGVPADELDALNEGVGVSNTRSRLEHTYGGRHRFEFSLPKSGGLEVTIVVPSMPEMETADSAPAVESVA